MPCIHDELMEREYLPLNEATVMDFAGPTGKRNAKTSHSGPQRKADLQMKRSGSGQLQGVSIFGHLECLPCMVVEENVTM